MKKFSRLRTTALLSTGIAALSLGACNQNQTSQNGVYVAASTASSIPASSQSAPPSTAYQAVANTPPPPIPVYDQPAIPGPGYIWTPGYWGWSNDADDYYWVPGTWVEPPDSGLLWTPGYWRFYNGQYLFSDGYWGAQVGFYGGVNYGFGYGGSGYAGGRWQGRRFYYNTQANNLGGRRIASTYSQGFSANGGRVSFNGGPGGLRATPAPAEIAAAHAPHTPPTGGQRQQARMAGGQPQLRASVNRGRPPIAATARPAEFASATGVSASRSAAAYAPPTGHGPAAGETAHPAAPPAPGRPRETSGRTEGSRGAGPVDRTVREAPVQREARQETPQAHVAQERSPAPEHAPSQPHAPAHAAAPPGAEDRGASRPQEAPDHPR